MTDSTDRDDTERAVMAMLRAIHDGRDGDASLIIGTMTARELQALAARLAGLCYQSLVRICALQPLVADEDALAVAMLTDVRELAGEGRELREQVTRMLAGVHEGIVGDGS